MAESARLKDQSGVKLLGLDERSDEMLGWSCRDFLIVWSGRASLLALGVENMAMLECINQETVVFVEISLVAHVTYK